MVGIVGGKYRQFDVSGLSALVEWMQSQWRWDLGRPFGAQARETQVTQASLSLSLGFYRPPPWGSDRRPCFTALLVGPPAGAGGWRGRGVVGTATDQGSRPSLV